MKKFSGSYVFKSERLEIRMFRPKDFANWQELHMSMARRRNMFDWSKKKKSELPHSSFTAMIASHRRLAAADSEYVFAVWDRPSKKIIGIALFRHIVRSKIQASAEIGYQISNLYWGQGYGTELVEALFVIGARSLGLRRIEAAIDPRNKRSLALASKVGMQRIGMSRGHLVFKGVATDMILFAKILRR